MQPAIADDLIRRIVESVHCAMMICDAQAEDTPLVYVNAAFEELTGYRSDEVLGRNPRFLQGEDRDQAEIDIVRTALTEGRNADVTLRNYRKDGSLFWVELSISPISNPAGGITHFSAIQRDVTVRKAALHALSESERRLSDVLENLPVGVFLIQNGTIQVNRAAEQITGYHRTELTDFDRSLSLLCGDSAEEVRRLWECDQTEGFPTPQILPIRDKAGTEKQIEFAICESGPQFICLLTDVTAQEDARLRMTEIQSELEQTARLSAMGETAAAIAHELNQPLTAASNYLQTVKLILSKPDLRPDPSLIDYLDKSDDEIHRAAEIIRRMRMFLRKAPIEKAWHNINNIIEESYELATLGSLERPVALRLRLAQNVPEVCVDKVQIEQVLVNLIRNALESMEESREAELSLTSTLNHDGSVRVDVADTGHGIPESVRSTLFRPFTSSKKDGMGVGLSICRSIVEQHGGVIEAHANIPLGSIFSFSLPRNGEAVSV